MNKINSDFSARKIYLNKEEIKECKPEAISRLTNLFKDTIEKSNSSKILKITINLHSSSEAQKIETLIKNYLNTTCEDENLKNEIYNFREHLSFSFEKKEVFNFKSAIKNPLRFLTLAKKKSHTDLHPLISLCNQIACRPQDAKNKFFELFSAFSKADLFGKLDRIIEAELRLHKDQFIPSFYEIYTTYAAPFKMMEMTEIKHWTPSLVPSSRKERGKCMLFANFLERHPKWFLCTPENNVRLLSIQLLHTMRECALQGAVEELSYIKSILLRAAIKIYQDGHFDKLAFFYEFADQCKDKNQIDFLFRFKESVESAKTLQSLEDPLFRAKIFAQHLGKYPQWIATIHKKEFDHDVCNLITHFPLLERELLDKMFDSCVQSKEGLHFLQSILNESRYEKIFDFWSVKGWRLIYTLDLEALKNYPYKCFKKMIFLLKCNKERFIDIHNEEICRAYFYAKKKGLDGLKTFILTFLSENSDYLSKERISKGNRLNRHVTRLRELGLSLSLDGKNRTSLRIQKVLAEREDWICLIKLLNAHFVGDIIIESDVDPLDLLISWLEQEQFTDVNIRDYPRNLLKQTLNAIGLEQVESEWEDFLREEENKENIGPVFNQFSNRDL